MTSLDALLAPGNTPNTAADARLITSALQLSGLRVQAAPQLVIMSNVTLRSNLNSVPILSLCDWSQHFLTTTTSNQSAILNKLKENTHWMDLLFTTSRDNLQLQIGTFGQLKKEKRLIANEALNKLSTFKFEMKACIADVEQGHGGAEGVERLKRYIEIGARTVENFGVCMQFVERPWKKGPFRQSEKLT